MNHPRQFNKLLLLSFPRCSVTAIKLAAHHDVGTGFSPRLDTHRSLKAAPTGLNLMALTPERGNDRKSSFLYVAPLRALRETFFFATFTIDA